MSHRVWFVLVALALVVSALALSYRPLLGIRRVGAGAPPPAMAPGPLSHQLLGEVLDRHLVQGRVDYEALVLRSHPLRRYVASLETTGPQSAPTRFPSREHRLAYQINAYNALALLGVVANWPITSVHDVRGPLEPRAGFGFFYALRFRLDGREVNLYDLEKQMLARFGDARIHAAINCASSSCPALASKPYTAASVDAMLGAAARRFTTSPHVRLDAHERRIVLSSIYSWYADDFRAHVRKLGAGSDVMDWIAHHASPARQAELLAARRLGYKPWYAPYDWGLNRANHR